MKSLVFPKVGEPSKFLCKGGMTCELHDICHRNPDSVCVPCRKSIGLTQAEIARKDGSLHQLCFRFGKTERRIMSILTMAKSLQML